MDLRMPRFAANLAFLFTERPLIERFASAAAAGFRAVELQVPYDLAPSAVKAELDRHGLTMLGINTAPGQAAAGAAVDNLGARAGDHDCERFHQPPATSSAVTRVGVHVPGPEAAGTVIRIAVALHQKPAAGAAETLDPAHEAAAHLQRPPAHEHPINLLRSMA